MLHRLLLCLSLMLAPLFALAEEVVLGMSRDSIAITTNFDGSDLLIFGAVKRDAPLQSSPLEVVITVAGPSAPVVVRKKERRFGIWINTEAVTVDEAPSFYAVAASGPLDEILSQTEDLRHKISIPKAIRLVGESGAVDDVERFSDAVIRIRMSQGVYQLGEGAVDLREETLFRTAIELPANLTEGAYVTRVFLVRDGGVVSHHETELDVRKVGLERWLFSLSREQPLLYGLMSLAIAIAAGWGASALFRVLRLS
ncbi:TIGR02186 family protein [Primorskyibacter sp. S187A]|uniref:TIGR02186 family protein n=1 Tax=Primorskyibacter sp. S187A TaxID=3415130 RepID=UPI003C7DBD30